MRNIFREAVVAQLARAIGFKPVGPGFESWLIRQFFLTEIFQQTEPGPAPEMPSRALSLRKRGKMELNSKFNGRLKLDLVHKQWIFKWIWTFRNLSCFILDSIHATIRLLMFDVCAQIEAFCLKKESQARQKWPGDRHFCIT